MLCALAIGGSAGCLFVLIALFLPLATAALQHPADAAILEVTSKRHSAGYLPVVGSYVEYEVRLTNEGAHAIENQSLRVSLVSENNRTHSLAAYSVPFLAPGDSKVLHFGPFKTHEEGVHRLLAEMDGVAFGYEPASFMVYRQEAVQAALIAIPLIAAGAGLVGFSLYRRKKAV